MLRVPTSEEDGELHFVLAGPGEATERASVQVRRRPGGRYFVVLGPGRFEAQWRREGEDPVIVATCTVEEAATRELDLEVASKDGVRAVK